MAHLKMEDQELWDRLKRIAGVLMMSGYYRISARPHPTREAVIFVIRKDEYNAMGAMLPLWRINTMNDLQIVEAIRDQTTIKWKRM